MQIVPGPFVFEKIARDFPWESCAVFPQNTQLIKAQLNLNVSNNNKMHMIVANPPLIAFKAFRIIVGILWPEPVV